MQLTPAYRPKRGRRRDRGFTLIELAVTFTLLGILIALGLPSFTAWIANSKVRTVAEAMRTGLHQAQTEAVRLNQSVVFSLTNANPALNATAVTNGKNWSIQTVAQFDRTAVFVAGGALTDVASGVAIATTPAGLTALCFNANGRLMANASSTGVPGASCSAGTQQFDISHTSSDRPLRVLVAVGGQIRLCDVSRPQQSDAAPDGCP